MFESMIPACAFSAEARGDSDAVSLYPGEDDVVATAATARRREFATGRQCARTALGRLGLPPQPILADAHRSPLWPPGITGSITHCPGFRAAAVAWTTDLASIGIDAEPDEPLPAGVLPYIATPGELGRIDAGPLPAGRLGRLLFSAKEAVYKAWYPLTGRWLGFEDAEITFHDRGTFAVRTLVAGPKAAQAPARFEGNWLAREGLLLTAVTVPAA